MSSITPDGARSEIIENALKVGNPVKTSSGLATNTSQNIVTDSSSNMKTVVPLTVVQPTNTDYVFDITAKGIESLITSSVVTSATAWTQIGALRVLITDSTGIGASTGAYYIPFGTLD